MENQCDNERIVKQRRLEGNKGQNASTSDSQNGSAAPNENKGRIILDATACPQDIAYPTDLNLLSEAREKTEELTDQLYNADIHEKKPRTYRLIARKRYTNGQKK